MSTQNLNMPKPSGGADEEQPLIISKNKIHVADKFEYALKTANRWKPTAISHINQSW